MTGIVERLLTELPNLPKKLEVAAKYAIDNPDRIAFGSMRSVAADCNVSSPTMLRLARHFGHNSYDDFKALFQSEVSSSNFGNRAERLYREQDDSLASGIRDAALRNVSTFFDANAAETIEAVSEMIRTAKTTYIIASGSMTWLAGHLENTGGIAFPGLKAPRPGFATAVETLGNLTKEDAVLGIGVAPYATSGVEAVTYAQTIGIRTASITDRRSSPFAAVSDHSLIVPTESPHYYASIVAVCAAIETILATAVVNSRGGAVRRIEHVVALRKGSGAYTG